MPSVGRTETAVWGAVPAKKGKNHPYFGGDGSEQSGCSRGHGKVPERPAAYGLPVFSKVVGLTRGDPELIRKLKTDPAPFDCNFFESDAQRLADSFSSSIGQDTSTTAVLYPGPFKMLILADGAMVRRGVPAKLSDACAQALIKLDGGLLLTGDLAEAAEVPLHFPSQYRAYGSLCLLGTSEAPSFSRPVQVCDLGALKETPSDMKHRQLKLVESNSE